MNLENAANVIGGLFSGAFVVFGQFLYKQYQDLDMGDVKAAKNALRIRDSAAPAIQGLLDIGAVEQATALQDETNVRAAKVLVRPAVARQRRIYGMLPYLVAATLVIGVLGIIATIIPSRGDTGLALVTFCLIGAGLIAWIENAQDKAANEAAKKVSFYPKEALPTSDEHL